MRHSLPCLQRSAIGSLLVAAGGLALAAVPACQSSRAQDKPIVDNGPMYTGAKIFHGTVGSLAKFANDEAMLVSGYGLVVNLRGRGSPEVLPYLSAYMQDHIRRGGFDPAAVLSDQNAAVVTVQGMIPPGAFAGDRFDLFVSSTVSGVSSLAGGRLYTTDLQPGPPARDPGKFVGKAGTGAGSVYMDPFDRQGWEKARSTSMSWEEFQRQGVILGGGIVGEDRPVHLLLNQASYSVANQIVDALNARFPPARADRGPVAAAKDSQRITLRVPQAFRNDPAAFIEQVRWLYVQRVDPSFAPAQTAVMVAALAEESAARRPEFAEQCVQAWKAMGKGSLPALRPAYALAEGVASERELWPDLVRAAPQDAKAAERLAGIRAGYPAVRDAAVRAGAALGDTDALALLAAAARETKDSKARIRCLAALAEQPNSKVALSAIHDLLGDADTAVRVAAGDAYARCFARLSEMVGPAEAEKWMGDFHRTFAYGPDQQEKYAVDVVSVGEPLVVMSVSGRPRVTIFGKDAGLKKPLSLWFDDSASRRALTDGPRREQALREMAASRGITVDQARAELEKIEQGFERDAAPLGGPGRFNLRVEDEPITEEMRTALARQMQQGQRVPFAEAYRKIPATRETLVLAFYPGDRSKQEFRAVNSLATLVFALGHHEGARYAQKGLSFDFDRVTRIVSELGRRDVLGAKVEIRVSPLADRMRRAAESARKPDALRPEGSVEDLSGVLGADAKPVPPAEAATPKGEAPKEAPKNDGGAGGDNPFKQ